MRQATRRRARRAGAWVAVALAGALLAACRSRPTDGPGDPAESPQALAVPAPLSLPPTASAAAAPIASAPSDAGPTVTALGGGARLEADVVALQAPGWSLVAVLRPGEVQGRAPEAPASAVDALRRKVEERVVLEVTSTRLRLAQAGAGFVLPQDAEVRARSDRYGHVAVWSGGNYYRPLPPGALRSFLDERRFDVAPLSAARVVPAEGGGRRFDVRTRRVAVTTRAGKADVELARFPESGDAGALLGRLLLDLLSGSPQTALLAPDEIPVAADLRWTDGGHLVFEVTNVLRKAALDPTLLTAPPAAARFGEHPLPTTGVTAMLGPAELGTLRGPSPEPAGVLQIVNARPELRVVLLDGVPVAWAAPLGRGEVRGLPAGRYLASSRTALGQSPEELGTVTVPGVLGAEPAP